MDLLGATRAAGPESAGINSGPEGTSLQVNAAARQEAQGQDLVEGIETVLTFLLWLVLLVLAWPLAIIALILYPILWLVSLPLRRIGISVKGVLELIKAIILLPGRVLRGPGAVRR